MTNFERIKKMSISEMAQLIDTVEYSLSRNLSEYFQNEGLDIDKVLDDGFWDANILNWLNKEFVENKINKKG